jgi:hypothetical protein
MKDPSFSRKGKKNCCKQSQDPEYFDQEYLSIDCMINQDFYRLAR